MNFQYQFLLQHSVHLRDIDVCRRERQKPWVINSGPNTKASHAGLWTNSISSDQLIYIRRCLLRSESLCRTISSRRQDNIGNSDRDTYLPALGWNIELRYISNVPWSRLHRWLPRNRGKHQLKLHRWGSPHHHGGLGRSATIDTLPSGDQKCLIPGRPTMEWYRIWIRTSTSCSSRVLWSQFSTWHLKALWKCI
jgi:hypothetical protein